MHIANSSAVYFVNGAVGVYDSNNSLSELESDLLFGVGRRGIRIEEYFLSPDAQWNDADPSHEVSCDSILIFEVGVFQSAGSLLTKVREYLRHSKIAVSIFIFKVWYDPLPHNTAMVAALWHQKEYNAQASGNQALQFVSFGNRPPTPSELSEFDVGTEMGLTLPPLTVITGEDGSTAMPEVRLPAQVLFAERGLEPDGPRAVRGLPDLVFYLVKARRMIEKGIEEDIVRRVFPLSPSELLQIISDADVQAKRPALHNFAVNELEMIAANNE